MAKKKASTDGMQGTQNQNRGGKDWFDSSMMTGSSPICGPGWMKGTEFSYLKKGVERSAERRKMFNDYEAQYKTYLARRAQFSGEGTVCMESGTKGKNK